MAVRAQALQIVEFGDMPFDHRGHTQLPMMDLDTGIGEWIIERSDRFERTGFAKQPPVVCRNEGAPERDLGASAVGVSVYVSTKAPDGDAGGTDYATIPGVNVAQEYTFGWRARFCPEAWTCPGGWGSN